MHYSNFRNNLCSYEHYIDYIKDIKKKRQLGT